MASSASIVAAPPPADAGRAPVRDVRLGTREAVSERRPDGTVHLRLVEPLRPYPRRLTERLVHWAEAAPERPFLTEPMPDGTRRAIGYRAMLDAARGVGQALLDRGLGPDRPVLILSENGIDNAVLALACLHVGVPYVPVTPAYALLSGGYVRLRHVVETCAPGLVYASSGIRYGEAVAQACAGTEFVVSGEGGDRVAATPFADLRATPPTRAVNEAFERIGPDTLGKILFTSGTVGEPKGVMFPQRMLCANRVQVAQHLPFLDEAPPVLVDWLPWHHTFGGTNNFGIALHGGGTLHIDRGKPTPEGIGATVEALRAFGPTLYFNTPQGLASLLPHLREDAALRTSFFSRLKLIYYGGAVLPEHVWEAYDQLSVATLGERILLTSGIGSTETGPTPFGTNWDPERRPTAGLPVPGVEAKIVPVEERFELRLKGPCITPGYWRDPARTAAAFDEEGFFRLGDAVTFIDPDRPEAGLRYDGRLGENFKLMSGIWASVADLRARALAAFAPYASEVVVAGEGEAEPGLLVFPDLDRLRALPCAAAGKAADPAVRRFFAQALARLNRGEPPSRRIARLLLEDEPPSLDTGELTAKMSISQATVLRRRRASIAALFSSPPRPDVVLPAEERD